MSDQLVGLQKWELPRNILWRIASMNKCFEMNTAYRRAGVKQLPEIIEVT